MRKSQLPEHMQHLRIDLDTGRPVPWIQAWKPTDDLNRNSIGYCEAARGMGGFFLDDPAADLAADFTMVAPQRQRQSMVFGLCQVCARPLDWGIRALPVSKTSVEEIDLHAQKVIVVHEPWLCPDCAYFAGKWCPHLIGRRSELDLIFVPVAGPDDCQLVMSNGWIEGPYEAATKEDHVALYAKVYLFQTDGPLEGVLANALRLGQREPDLYVAGEHFDLEHLGIDDLRLDDPPG